MPVVTERSDPSVARECPPKPQQVSPHGHPTAWMAEEVGAEGAVTDGRFRRRFGQQHTLQSDTHTHRNPRVLQTGVSWDGHERETTPCPPAFPRTGHRDAIVQSVHPNLLSGHVWARRTPRT